MEQKEFDTLDLRVYFKHGEETSYLYEDAHDGYAYEQDDFKFSKFELRGDQNQITISQHIEGIFKPSIKQYKISLVGGPKNVSKIICDGKEVGVDGAFKISADFKVLEIFGA